MNGPDCVACSGTGFVKVRGFGRLQCATCNAPSAPSTMSDPLSFVGVLAEHAYVSTTYTNTHGVWFSVCKCGDLPVGVKHREHLDSVLREHVREAVEAVLGERCAVLSGTTFDSHRGYIDMNDLRALIGDRR